MGAETAGGGLSEKHEKENEMCMVRESVYDDGAEAAEGNTERAFCRGISLLLSET